jgi:hypothetical protein
MLQPSGLPARRIVAFLVFAVIVGAAFGLFVWIAQPGWWTPMPVPPG